MKGVFSKPIYFVVLFLASVTGCDQQETVSKNDGLVFADEAYRNSFGPPPQVNTGQAYASVAYLPLLSDPQKVHARPVFYFSQKNQLEKILKKLISGDLVSKLNDVLYNPFPEDLDLLIHSTEQGTLTLKLQTGKLWKEVDQMAAVQSLVQTAVQFETVEKVKVFLNGSPVPEMPPAGFPYNAALLAEIQPPVIMLIGGVWEKGMVAPEEVLVEFDRPIRVNSFKLFHKDGRKVEGEYFTSIFQMAIVIHPIYPKLFQEGTVLTAAWDVVDELGRRNHGRDSQALIKYVH